MLLSCFLNLPLVSMARTFCSSSAKFCIVVSRQKYLFNWCVLFVRCTTQIRSSFVQIGFGDCGKLVDLSLKLFFYFLAKLFLEFLNV